MTQSLQAISTKVKRAEKHIADCHLAIEEFKAINPYEIIPQPEIKADRIVYDIKRADDVPLHIRAIAGDVIQNLRTALDYLACAIVPSPTNRTYFPILKQAPTPDQIKAAFDGKINGASQFAIDEIAGLKPYKGGNNILWRLHELNKRDKHNLLVATQASISRFKLGGGFGYRESTPDIAEMLANILIPVKGGCPLKEGGQFFIDAPSPESNQGVYFLVEVVIDEANVCEAQPLIGVLRESLREVMRVVGKLSCYVLR